MIAVDKARDLSRVARRVNRNSSSLRRAVREAEKRYPKKAGKKEWHHIVPQYMGGPKDGPTVRVSAAYHQWITNEFRRKWAYGQKVRPSTEQLKQFMKAVYDKYPLPKN